MQLKSQLLNLADLVFCHSPSYFFCPSHWPSWSWDTPTHFLSLDFGDSCPRPGMLPPTLVYLDLSWVFLCQSDLNLSLNAVSSMQSNSHICMWLLEKTIALTIQTFVSKMMFLLFNTLSRFVIPLESNYPPIKNKKQCTQYYPR